MTSMVADWHREVAKTINDNPRLLSLLYDNNLLPEQVDTEVKLQAMNLAVAAYHIGLGEVEKSNDWK